MKIVTSEDFETEVLKSDKPVLVDFFATWCPPCKALSPILETIAAEKADSLKIVKVDVDASPEIAAQYYIKSMPTLLMVRDGEVIAKTIGAAPKSEVVKWIDSALTLPAGTKVDITPKVATLSGSDKQRLRDVFEAAVNASPDADKPTTLLTPDGSETTLRKTIKDQLDSGEIFKQMETLLSNGVTLDQLISSVKQAKLRIPKGPKH
ncbi:MAG: thioredoxin [Proteobacteria bacterium]|nr:thioredoxin [Pseudomonadota bacterium]